jgi:heme exporter protein B
MRILSAIIQRDLRIALRSGGKWMHGLVFFILYLSLSAIAVGGDFNALRPIAPALIWLAVLFSLLFSFDQVFRQDAEDGSLEHIKFSGIPISHYVCAKAITHWLLTVGPLILALPLAGLLFNLPLSLTAGLLFSVLFASPALVLYGIFSASCLVGYKGGGILLVLLTTPLIFPILIFALSSVISYENVGLGASEFLALGGINLIALAVIIPASTGALNTYLE